MTNADMIRALRYCATDADDEFCVKCAYFDRDCEKLKLDAADALEADEKRIAELEARMPKEGEWIYTPLERYKEYKVKCPFCGAEYHDCYDGYIDAEDMNYCPHCGAKMDRKENADADN